ncbi:MAG: hypothetical protein AB8C84_13045 [Oligoflexales bacterium]
MITVWELGIDTTTITQGHDVYSSPMRPSVFEFDNTNIIQENDGFDIVISSKPKGLIQSIDFSTSGFPGRQDYGHGVDLNCKNLIYNRVLLVPLSSDTYMLVCRKKNT